VIAVTLVAWVNAAVWIGLLMMNWEHLLHRTVMPDGLRQAIIVALLAGSVGSAVSALGFAAVWDSEWSAWLSAAWRAAMLSAGVYGVFATLQGRRRGQ
jgi:hypothetical protein